MLVTLVGFGCGTAETMTLAGWEAVTEADCLIGAARLLDALDETCTSNRHAATRAEEILALLETCGGMRPCVLYSGDTGFYSGAKSLLPLLRQAGYETQVLPGISSVQYFAAQLERPWQDWTLVSAHGTDCNAVTAVLGGRPVFFLTGGTLTPTALCCQLAEAGLGDMTVTVGEELSYPNQRIVQGTAADLAGETFAPLSVLLAEAVPPVHPARTAGFPDADFIRGKTPMTKQEVRAAVLAKLAVQPLDTVWDVGAGTGSVSVELARAARQGRVFAVECDAEACGLIAQNRQRFGAWNLKLVAGYAPEALRDLPTPDAVFIGGSKGALSAVVDAALEKNPLVRLCIAAIALETLTAAVTALTAHGISAEVTQLSVSRTRAAGELHLLLANNPVFLISGQKSGETP